MNGPLLNVVNDLISEREILQPDVEELLERLIGKVVEAGVVYKDSGEYRYGSEKVGKDNTTKRIINGISGILKSPGGYRVGLVSTTEESLSQQHRVLVAQIRQCLGSFLEQDVAEKAASDIADVVLTSWFLVWCQPNESGWAKKWV